MPISSPHPQYEASAKKWSRVRDVKSGSDDVKGAGTRYLPRLGGQTTGDYDQYRYRAMFLPVVSRTIRTLVGLSTFKRPNLTGPAKLDLLEESIGTEGQPLDRIAASIMEEQVSVGRVGALVDVDPEDATAPPAVSLYHAENIINWNTTMIQGREVATTVVLRETRLTKALGDPYLREFEEIYRELGFGSPPSASSPVTEYALRESDIEAGVYYQVIWSRSKEENGKASGDWQRESIVVPRGAGGAPLTEIPFVCFNSGHLGLKVGEVPMDDLATINLSHYLNSADLEHGRHFTALPTAWLAGFEFEGDVHIGSTKAWVTDNESAKAGYLEFTGAGLNHLQQGMEQKERLMAVVGVRFLETGYGGPEKPETLRLRQQGDRANLVSMMDVVEDGINTLLRYCLFFMSAVTGQETIKFSMARDFTETRLDPNLLAQYINAVQGGLLSWESFVHVLGTTGTLPDGVDADEEARRLLAGIPGSPTVAVGGDPAPDEPEEAEEGPEDE
jgi:hypothetical protein